MELYVTNAKDGTPPIDVFSSLRWRRKYFEPGEFELHVPATPYNLDLLKPGAVIQRVGRKEVGIVETNICKGYDLAVSGRFASYILEGIVVDALIYSGTALGAMQTLAQQFSFRNLSFSALTEDSTPVNIQARWRYLLDLFVSLSKASGMGFRLHTDGTGYTNNLVEVYRGTDHSVNQSDVSPVVFSDDLDNLEDAEYTYSVKGFRGNAVVAGQGEGDARIYTSTDYNGPAGNMFLYDRSLYVDARDLQQGSLTYDQYIAQLKQRGIEKLLECPVLQSLDASALDTGQYQYITDWDLGDIVTVMHRKWGVTISERITEVEEIYEKGTQKIIPTFGNPLPEKLDLGDD